ncbi:hypothetical protein [Marinimicrobium locisalis]|uniref:hypothetical protein n=1 Tax=Marinimicrobium locisalis TaxID=546022 RepID=UPI00322167AB
MVERQSNKANDKAAIERRLQKQAAQNYSCGEVNEQRLSETAPKNAIRFSKMNYLAGRGNMDNSRLAPGGQRKH